MSDNVRPVLDYHERTKHHFGQFAAGPHGLDWANQPDPFRTFDGAPRIELALAGDGPDTPYPDFWKPGRVSPAPPGLAGLSVLLELSFGLSAWKQYGGTRWALRCNPSSGNLHPTEAYVVLEACPGIADGVYHYVSRDHVLEHRCAFRMPVSRDTTLPAGTFLLGLSSIHWREAWKYGERAYRYCQHDAGHAVAAVRIAAAVLGWHARLLAAWGDADVGAVLGTDRDNDFGPAEREHPDLMLAVCTGAAVDAGTVPAEPLVAAARDGLWHGQANRLSVAHSHDWPVIDEAASACTKPVTRETVWQPPELPEPVDSPCAEKAATIIRRRRSAQAFDGATSISADVFYRLLDMTLPRAGIPPWDTVPWQPRVHLLLFVHRVDGLSPGLYLFLRNPCAGAMVRAVLSSDLEHLPVPDCPDHFSFVRLASGDARQAARALCCHQDIAADGAFSLGMLAEYESGLARGAWIYRQLHWEAGMIGQVLYLEAEAAGVRGTGIGCYFDDGVHELAGIENRALQSLYHFTVGGPLTDTRLQTLPAYAHLHRRGDTGF